MSKIMAYHPHDGARQIDSSQWPIFKARGYQIPPETLDELENESEPEAEPESEEAKTDPEPEPDTEIEEHKKRSRRK